MQAGIRPAAAFGYVQRLDAGPAIHPNHAILRKAETMLCSKLMTAATPAARVRMVNIAVDSWNLSS